jgi:hypothetical protein
VKVAVGLLVALLAAGPVHDLFPDPASARLIAAVLVAVVVGIAICTAIALGKRRAVFIYVVLFVGFLVQLALSATMLHSNFADFVWNATLRATAVAAILLLFSQLARSWFAATDERPVVFHPHMGRRL